MKDPGTRIHDAFKGAGKVTEKDFGWLIKFLRDQQKAHPGGIELLNFSVEADGSSVSAVLLVERASFAALSEELVDRFPTPFTMRVLNHADPNPGGVVVVIGWGGGH